jgi:peptidoglycan/LPS O-acetylase OafA/YrhL
MVSKKQVIWTLAMSITGLFLGLKGQDTTQDMFETALITLWFGSIGFGIGGIFSQRMSPRWIIISWIVGLAGVLPVVTLASAAALLPNWSHLPLAQQVIVGISGACIGALLGIGAGRLHVRHLQTNSSQAEIR